MDTHPLSRLQDIDLQVDAFRVGVRTLEGALARCREELARLEAESARVTETKQTAQLKARRLEGEVTALEEKIKGLEAKILRVTSSKQLEALQHENEAARTRTGELEEALLEAYGEVEAAEVALRDLGARVDEKKETELELAHETARQVEDLKSQARAVWSGRESATAGIDATLLETYAALRKRYGGAVLIATEDNACLGCGETQSGVVFNRLKGSGGKPVPCANCGRLLVYVGINE